MNEGLIPNRYAKALYDYAIEQKAAGSVYDEANRLASVYEAESGKAIQQYLMYNLVQLTAQ